MTRTYRKNSKKSPIKRVNYRTGCYNCGNTRSDESLCLICRRNNSFLLEEQNCKTSKSYRETFVEPVTTPKKIPKGPSKSGRKMNRHFLSEKTSPPEPSAKRRRTG